MEFALSVAAVMQVTWQKVFSSLLEFALELQMHQEDSLGPGERESYREIL